MHPSVLTLTFLFHPKTFGFGEDEPELRFEELNRWKTETQTAHAAFLEDEKDIERHKQEAILKVNDECRQYVNDRFAQITRQQRRLQRTLEVEEANRVAKRQADRDARRAARIAGYEREERRLMTIEDDLSYRRRFYEWEVACEAAERERMFNEECDQCEVDRYWGIDLAEQLRLEEEERQRRLFEGRVEAMRVKCVNIQIIRPYVHEARNKVFRDRRTGKVLT